MEVINLRLLAHPVNWLFVWAILFLAGIAFHEVNSKFRASNSGSAAITPD